MASVELRGIRKSFGKSEIIRGIDLTIADQEFVVFVGPSGCGKSTLLRLIAGLEDADAGEIRIADRVVNQVPPKDRDIAMVFQNYALYPHMTVARNMGFGLRAKRLPAPEIDRRVNEAAAMLGLQPLLQRRPGELSGGQRQRVAMGRALVRDPAVFLFDEPLSNLDAQLRQQVRTEIKRLHQQVRRTAIYVTHDQVEAMTLADRIVLLRDGRIEQVGTPMALFARPANRFVARFIGSPAMNLLPAMIEGHEIVLPWLRIPCPELIRPTTGPIELGIRPDDIRFADTGFQALVRLVEPMGSESLLVLDVDGTELQMRLDGRQYPMAGSQMTCALNATELHIFDTQTGQNLRKQAVLL